MKASWHRSSVTLWGKAHEPNTTSGYLEYDLRGWFFGIGLDVDMCWYDARFHFGPITLNIIAWRSVPVEILD